MSTHTHHSEALWSNIQNVGGSVIGASLLRGKESFDFLQEVGGLLKTETFHGKITVEGDSSFSIERNFYVSAHGNSIRMESFPEPPLPIFVIEIITGKDSDTVQLAVSASESSVDAAVLSTRISSQLIAASRKTFSIQSSQGDFSIQFQLHGIPEEVSREAISSAKLFRKIKFIEECFNVNFSLPDNLTAKDARLVEIIFRGITEGEFTTRDSQYVFEDIIVKKGDLNSPPFSSEGEIQGKIRSPLISLFGKQLDVGSIAVYLRHALVSDPHVLEKVEKNPNQPINVRFEGLDNQVHHRFERYARQSIKQRRRRLELFKKQLAREEPQWLVDLIDESLQYDVSADEAAQIAAGWQQYNNLPDRFCPQEPILEQAENRWRVPIYLVYANGEGGEVGEITIDLKTGEILRQTSIEELKKRGMAIAKKITNA